MKRDDTQLRHLQRLVEKWCKHVPNRSQGALADEYYTTGAVSPFHGYVGVDKGQRYAYKRVLRQIEAIKRENDAHRCNTGNEQFEPTVPFRPEDVK